MIDQAESLRKMMNFTNPQVPIITVGSARKRAGKSFFIRTLAAGYAQKGKRVLIASLGDADTRVQLSPNIAEVTLDTALLGVDHLFNGSSIRIYDRIKGQLDNFDIVLMEVNSECEYLYSSMLDNGFLNIVILNPGFLSSSKNAALIQNYSKTLGRLNRLLFVVNRISDGSLARDLMRKTLARQNNLKPAECSYLGHIPKAKFRLNTDEMEQFLLKLNKDRKLMRCLDFVQGRVENELFDWAKTSKLSNFFSENTDKLKEASVTEEKNKFLPRMDQKDGDKEKINKVFS